MELKNLEAIKSWPILPGCPLSTLDITSDLFHSVPSDLGGIGDNIALYILF